MEALEISNLWLIAGSHQGLEAVLDEGANTTAENSLLTKEVSFSFFSKGSLDTAGTGTTNTTGISQCQLKCMTGSILLYSKYIWNTTTLSEGTTYKMARALRGNHKYINVLWWNNLLEMNIETMSEGESCTRLQIRSNLIFVYLSLLLIWNQNHDNICSSGSLTNWQNLKALAFSNFLGTGPFIKTNNHIQATFLQVQCVCMTLGTITNNGNSLILNNFPINILIIKDFCHNTLSPHNILV